jgi:hypothetical protein
MAPRDSGDDKAEEPVKREKGFATLAELRYVPIADSFLPNQAESATAC